MWSPPISVASLKRQINRIRRLGLVPVYDADAEKMRVCEEVPRIEVQGGIAVVRTGPWRQIASVDDDHPVAAVLHNRIANGEIDMASRARRADAIARRQAQGEMAELDAEIRAWWRERKRLRLIRTVEGMHMQDVRGERRRRRERGK
jgi:hypothetical protein